MINLDFTDYLFENSHVFYKKILFDNCTENSFLLENKNENSLRLNPPVFVDLRKCDFVFKSNYQDSIFLKIAKCLIAPFRILSHLYPFSKIFIFFLNKKKAKVISRKLEIAKVVSEANEDILNEFKHNTNRVKRILSNKNLSFKEKKRQCQTYISYQKNREIKRSERCFSNLIVIAINYSI